MINNSKKSNSFKNPNLNQSQRVHKSKKWDNPKKPKKGLNLYPVLTVSVFTTTILVLLLMYKRIHEWMRFMNHLYCVNPFGQEEYVPKAGDIVCRYIRKLGIFPKTVFKRTVMHVGVIVDENTVYNTGFTKTECQSMDEFMCREEYLYIMQFPEHYYRPLNEGIKMFKKWLEAEKHQSEKYANYNAFNDNCETRALKARIKPEYVTPGTSYQTMWFKNFNPFKSNNKMIQQYPFKLLRYKWVYRDNSKANKL